MKTTRDPESSADTLVAKKGAKGLAAGSVVLLTVINRKSHTESAFVYLYIGEGFSARFLNPSFLSGFTTLDLRVGEHILIDFRTFGGAQNLVGIDERYFARIESSPYNREDFQLYRAELAGDTSIRLEVRFEEPGPLIRDVFVSIE